MKPAIVVVAYNRPKSLERLLNSIGNSNFSYTDIPLIISIDKADNEKEVIETAKVFNWTYGKKIIRTFDKRQGLKKHVMKCGDLSDKYGAVIILEDDLIVSPGFYTYVEKSIDFYQNDSEVTGIALYSHEWNGYSGKYFQPIADEFDTYLGQFSITWGQCWTKRWWDLFKKWYELHENKLNFNTEIPKNINSWSEQSWGRYFVNYIFDENKYYVIPRISLTTNCSEAGQHAIEHNHDHQVRLMNVNKETYIFAPCDKACRYDIFFENMQLGKYFNAKIQEEGLEVDLSGEGRNSSGKRYLLTTRILPYQVIQSYGLQLRPIDMNVIYSIQGSQIFLYDKKKAGSRKENNLLQIVRYEIRGISNKILAKYLCYIFFEKVKKIMR